MISQAKPIPWDDRPLLAERRLWRQAGTGQKRSHGGGKIRDDSQRDISHYLMHRYN